MTTVAIVLPSYDRPDHLKECLASLARLDGGPYRTIVVDDGSPQPLAPVCAAFGDWVTCLRQPNAGPAAARNAGVAQVHDAEIICFIDDDCRPVGNWVQRLLATHAGETARLVGGQVVGGLDENAFARASQAILGYSYGHFGDFTDRLSFFTTNNLCVSRQAFLDLGGFDTRYDFASEDRDLSFRWRQSGGILSYADDAVVHHFHRMTLRGFIRQQYTYGRGARRFHQTVASQSRDPVKMGSHWFYLGLLLHPLRRPSPRAVVTTFLIGLAHAALAVGYYAEARKEPSNKT